MDNITYSKLIKDSLLRLVLVIFIVIGLVLILDMNKFIWAHITLLSLSWILFPRNLIYSLHYTNDKLNKIITKENRSEFIQYVTHNLEKQT